MPELPEVESIRRGLEPKIRGRRIARVELRLAKQLKNASPAQLQARLGGKSIQGIRRRGKFMVLEAEAELLLIHLGMTGQLTFWDHRLPDAANFVVLPHTGLQKTATQHAPDKHTHLLIHLEGGDRIQFRDIRQFGHLHLFREAELAAFRPFASLGVEPLADDFSFPRFMKLLETKRGALKPMLLSQRPIAGLGNIYVDEALYLARLHPLRKAESLKLQEWRALYKAIPAVLRQGLKFGGTTLMDYRDAMGGKGQNQERLKAYGRSGKPCRRCKKTLERIIIAQRSSVFCPSCQRLR